MTGGGATREGGPARGIREKFFIFLFFAPKHRDLGAIFIAKL